MAWKISRKTLSSCHLEGDQQLVDLMKCQTDGGPRQLDMTS